MISRWDSITVKVIPLLQYTERCHELGQQSESLGPQLRWFSMVLSLNCTTIVYCTHVRLKKWKPSCKHMGYSLDICYWSQRCKDISTIHYLLDEQKGKRSGNLWAMHWLTIKVKGVRTIWQSTTVVCMWTLVHIQFLCNKPMASKTTYFYLHPFTLCWSLEK